MTEKRRYRENEVREIFEHAASQSGPDPFASPDVEGLTLAEIQRIGLEAGLDPTEVAHAALALDSRGAKPQRHTLLGMPIEVRHEVPLPRAPDEAEWEQIVAELRSTFRAQGKVHVQGNIKEWTNGNLHVCVEPTNTGHRLRLGTLKGDARTVNGLAALGLASGAFAFGSLLIGGGLAEGLFMPVMLSASGIAAFVFNRLRLPHWAHVREQQMEYAATRIVSMLVTTREPTGEVIKG